MADDHWSPHHRIPERQPTPGEPLFEFVRVDGAPMSCEIRCQGESYGWEARVLERGDHAGVRTVHGRGHT